MKTTETIWIHVFLNGFDKSRKLSLQFHKICKQIYVKRYSKCKYNSKMNLKIPAVQVHFVLALSL